MGLSETIVAAIIGALATMGTAIFQLVRNRAPSETRPKKNRTRSVLATIALMIGCIVGGYAWSALRAVSAKEEMRATMQEEFTRQFAEFAARQNQPAATTDPAGGTLASGNRDAGAAESVAQLPPCKIDAHPDEVGPVICTERDAQPIALCAAIPADAQTSNIRVQARVPKSEAPWQERDAGATSIGNLHIGAAPAEFPIDPELRSVCLDVANWSVEDTLAVRMIVEYATAKPPATELTAAAPNAHTL
ncbi:MAG TPA: hypothetical protein VFV88_10530 [Steroidobacteraceae bacterium]|jgi:hypothetical protein|nr:hypothetical protein [Steroidobacteraceae bacterium]